MLSYSYTTFISLLFLNLFFNLSYKLSSKRDNLILLKLFSISISGRSFLFLMKSINNNSKLSIIFNLKRFKKTHVFDIYFNKKPLIQIFKKNISIFFKLL
jgi:hypothetical protein